jgi:hypothetical protein
VVNGPPATLPGVRNTDILHRRPCLEPEPRFFVLD